ncbi:hypothetical protein AMAG_07189 [Allomyces macrogynus ATCC 38327]|uniref:Queuosine 5'-phosphate N-glycosylase/hydrolase n=1 Tax=Allomyces macrogynus (strain ATCC 38327) TaxID=578462 RepID=A0A0L0SHQ6_ALLM3|nr:hypothetical protein AMAG_07189 [Allomyces macrogynus ATCC 38327]|eukprot:KNE61920.1 hypothetical protein AMAG_07189 [Allomyces macrogynus ATCC 38327]
MAPSLSSTRAPPRARAPAPALATASPSSSSRKTPALPLPSQRVLDSCCAVVEHAGHVRVGDAAAIERAAHTILDGLVAGRYSTASWRAHPLHPQVADRHAAEFIFLLDLMNFSFWSDSDTLYTVTYRGVAYTGYWSLVAAINRARDEGIVLTSAYRMATMSRETLRHVFRSDSETPISLPEERLEAIRHAGQVLLRRFGGSFVNLIKEARGSCQALIELVLQHFPTFDDRSTYMGKTVYLYKRVQILVADLWACFEGRGLGAFHDIDLVTMFADYRVPQGLVHLGLLEYSPALLAELCAGDMIPPGSATEVEIRAASIWAVELVARRIKELLREQTDLREVPMVNAILIDFYVWDYAKAHPDELAKIPIHRTRTIFY